MDIAKKIIKISFIVFIGTLIGCIANYFIYKHTVEYFAFIPQFCMYAFGTICLIAFCIIGLTALLGFIAERFMDKSDK